jgi:hypothetical protein
MGGVEVTLTVSKQSALSVPMMLVKLARIQDQQDSRLWRGLSRGLVVLLRV